MSGRVYDNLSFDDYRALDAYNKSSFDERGPNHTHARRMHGIADTDALSTGRIVHTACLEPDEFARHYAVCQHPGNIKAGKAERAALKEAGKEIVSKSEWALASSIQKAITQNVAVAMRLSIAKRREVSLTWDDPATGLPCKARLDAMTDGPTHDVYDLKTCTDASEEQFGRDVVNYGYHVQAAFYADGMRACGLNPGAFYFVACEKTDPFEVAIYDLSNKFLDLGRRTYQRVLAWSAAWDGKSPDYHDEPVTLLPPEWLMRREAI